MGQAVTSATVEHFLNEDNRRRLADGEYYICLSEDCRVAYYCSDPPAIFEQNDINPPIWFKKDAAPKYICYCNKITEQQIMDAVTDQGAKTLKDIMRLTGAMQNANCEINNPLGVCCGPVIRQTIDKALNKSGQ
ncbi:MAG: (2Fe-2S)-binding protein [Clostridia bacterium]|nr:(2Fe-2S)-binding protein [Clostridia bacterium]